MDGNRKRRSNPFGSLPPVLEKKKYSGLFEKYGKGSKFDLNNVRNLNNRRLQSHPQKQKKSNLVKKLAPINNRSISNQNPESALISSLFKKVKSLEEKNKQAKSTALQNNVEIQEMKNLLRKRDEQISRNAKVFQMVVQFFSDVKDKKKKFIEEVDFFKDLAENSMKECLSTMETEGSIKTIQFNAQRKRIALEKNKRININLIEKRVAQLNNLVVEGEKEIVYDNQSSHRRAQFAKRKEVTITFWQNGIIINHGPFRPYEWKITQAFLCDIIDGYFPFEFKEKYPNGVIIKVIDKKRVTYTKSLKVSDDMINNKKVDLNYIKRKGGKGLVEEGISKKQFLKKLPKQVIKNGEVINVRAEIKKLFKGGEEGGNNSNKNEKVFKKVEIPETDAFVWLKNGKIEKKNVAIIKVKVPKRNGLSEIVVHLLAKDTIQSLRKEVDDLVGGMFGSYRIRCPPNKFLDDEKITLKSAGLVPNAIVHVVVSKKV